MTSLVEFAYFVVLLRMIYRIRHINDDTLIKRECAAIVAIWLNLALFSLIAFFCQQIFQCNREPTKDRLFYESTAASYWLILIRDLSTLVVMLWYTRIVLNAQTSLEQQDETISLLDFDMMLVSVLPHKYFVSFLQEEKRSSLPYLQIIHIYKLYENEY